MTIARRGSGEGGNSKEMMAGHGSRRCSPRAEGQEQKAGKGARGFSLGKQRAPPEREGEPAGRGNHCVSRCVVSPIFKYSQEYVRQNVAKHLGRWQGASVNFPVNERKATDAVARLIEKSGADVDYLRISKLIYLADRDSILERGIPIVGGHYFSMRKGPVISEVLNFVKCRNAPRWKGTISPLHGHYLNLVQKPNYESLTHVEVDILDAVVAEHFNRSTEDLVNWCHDNCGEYEQVNFFRRKPIAVEKILELEGKSEKQIQKISDRAEELTALQEMLG